jgi:hypothetical protein
MTRLETCGSCPDARAPPSMLGPLIDVETRRTRLSTQHQNINTTTSLQNNAHLPSTIFTITLDIAFTTDPGTCATMDNLSLSDSDPDALFDSPDTKRKKQQSKKRDNAPAAIDGSSSRTVESRFSADEAREVSLKAELDSIRNINRVVEDVVASLEKAKANMQTVNGTINHSQTLLQTWSRILSVTEHNQRLILNPNWNGATQDLADMENEEAQRQAAAERKQAEDQARREEVARRAEEEERRKAVAAQTTGKRGSSGYGRVTRGRVASGSSRTTPASSVASSGYGFSGQSSRGGTRTTGTRRAAGSGVGRGARGRGRGTT